MNIVLLCGSLTGPASARERPDGEIVWSFDLATDTDEGKLSVPVVWLGDDRAAAWDAGTSVLVAGRVRRRFFRSGGSTQSRTEVVAAHVTTIGVAGPGVKVWRQAWAALGPGETATLRSGVGALPGVST